MTEPAVPGTPDNTPPANPPATPPATPETPPAEKAWYGEDEALKGLVEAKGWKSPTDALQSYQHLERAFGADKAGRALVIPKDESDAEGWNNVYSKLGRPEKAEDYKLPVPEGDDGTFAKAISPLLHKAGITQSQAKVLASEWNAMQAAQAEAEAAELTATGEREIKELKTEWGNAYDQNTELAKRAFREFGDKVGLDAESLTKVEKAMGTGKMLKMFSEIGKLTAEDTTEGMQGGSSSFKMTPAAAKERIEALKKDPEWTKRFTNGGADERKTWDDLHRAAYPS